MKVFGLAQGKDPRGQQWSLEDFGEYFRNERGNIGNSKKFQEVIRAFDEFSGLRGEPVNQETAIKMVKANENLKKACQAYVESRRGARSGSGKERLAVVDCLSMFREDLNLDQARDMKVVRSLEGKTWEQAGRFEVAQVVLGDGDKQMVGDAMSQRLMVEHGGKKGFFTEQMYTESWKTRSEKLMEKLGETSDPAQIAAVEAVKDNVMKWVGVFAGKQEFPEKDGELEIAEYTSNLREGDPVKESLRTILADLSIRENAGKILVKYQDALEKSGPDLSREKKGELMDKVMKDTILGNFDKETRENLRACKEAFMDMPPVERVNSYSVRSYRAIRTNFLAAKEQLDGSTQAGRDQREMIDRALEDRNFMQSWQEAVSIAHASDLGSSVGKIAVDEGNELSSRNIASSRVAELLGIGGIIAHSEKMVVKSGDRVVTGCFMEFAEGMDITAKGERKQRVLEQVDTSIKTPGFYKDMATMEVFDFLCAQNDRHERNMFYKIGEPDENGKRAVIGLQGIDGDLAFGEGEGIQSNYQGALTDMTFIPKDLAEKINGLDEDTLRYAIGDLIPDHQIQAMMVRVEKFKEHMNKKMLKLDDNSWDLTPLKKDEKEMRNSSDKMKEDGKEKQNLSDKMDEAEKKIFEEGIQSLKRADKDKDKLNTWDKIHKNAMVNIGFNAFNTRRQQGPKVAISFEEMKNREKNVDKKEPKMTLGKKSEDAVARAQRIREQRRKELEAQKGNQTPGKEASGPEKKSLGAGRRK